jgi:hypothetical protein
MTTLQLDPNRYDACPPYNDWLDAQYQDQSGPLDILSFQPRPSEVLFTMSPDTYQAIFPDFIQYRGERVRELVYDFFPSPIAYYFYRYSEGAENELQQLHFLRDTWEAVIDILHVLAVAEVRHHRLTLAEPIKFKDLLTESVAKRLSNIEEIIQQFHRVGVSSIIGRIAPITTLQAMRELNQSRNAFSHSAAQSALQAQNWISESQEDVIEILDNLRGLAELEIIRFSRLDDAQTLRGEPFVGHSSTRRFKKISITPAQLASSAPYLRQGQLLLVSRDTILSLRPLMHYKEDTVGHTTRLCMFRRAHGEAASRRIEYEIVGESSRYEEDRTIFSTELNELRALFGLDPD